MKSIHDQLKLKRHESPSENYVDDFVREFHHRQRIAARRKSPVVYWGLWRNWFREWNAAKWVYSAGLGYACFMGWLLYTPSFEDKQRGIQPTRINLPEPATLKTLEQIKADEQKSNSFDDIVKPAASNPF